MTISYATSMFVLLLLLGRRCTPAASRIAAWWATLSMRRAPY